MAAPRHTHLLTVGDTTPIEITVVDKDGRPTEPRGVVSARFVLRESPVDPPLIDLAGTVDGAMFRAAPTQAEADALRAGIFLGQLAVTTDRGTILSDVEYFEVEDRIA